MSKPRTKTGKATVADICTLMETIAPTGLAQEWDNVGLLAGDLNERVRRILLCIDLTPSVVEEAIERKVDLVFAYHPPILKPIRHIRTPSTDTEAIVFRCIKHGIAIYASHTALDAAEGGPNDVLAALCGVKESEPIEYVDHPGQRELKLVVFVPAEQLEEVAGAMFEAGAGHIGDYHHCSYRTSGQGTFFGGETTSPAVGQRGRMECVDEIRLEAIVPVGVLPAVVQAMIRAHPYEEPAFDVYPLQPKPVHGPGRWGTLPRGMTLGKLARKLKRATGAVCPQIVGAPDRIVERAIVTVGSAGSMIFKVPLTGRDVIVTGEIRHHDALSILRHDATAIALGHWTSERPVLAPLAERLATAFPGIDAIISEADREPFGAV